MNKISYRIVYNRKKRLNAEGKALLQVEAYLKGKRIYFSKTDGRDRSSET